MHWKNVIKNSYNAKWPTDLYTIAIKIPIDFFYRNRKIHREPKRPQIAKAISSEYNKAGDIKPSHSKMYYEATVI